jgi:hypothetical protein
MLYQTNKKDELNIEVVLLRLTRAAFPGQLLVPITLIYKYLSKQPSSSPHVFLIVSERALFWYILIFRRLEQMSGSRHKKKINTY